MKLKHFIAIFILLLTATNPVSADGIDHAVILEFLPNPDTPNDIGEYVTIHNPTDEPIDVSGFILTDLEGEVAISQGTLLEPGSEYTIELPKGGVALRNTGDEVILLDSTENPVDCVIYGDSGYDGIGWCGDGLGKASDERIFRRFYLDGDTDTAYEWLPLRECLRGQSSFIMPVKNVSCNLTAFTSPDCSLDVLLGEIRDASIIRVNVYLFENHFIEEEVLSLLDRGGEVYLLIEHAPIGGISDSELSIIRNIIERGGKARFTNDPLYRLNHAKYALFDDDTILIGSENWNDGGFPLEGSGGNRGWGVVIKNEEVFCDLREVFEYDWERGVAIAAGDLPDSVDEDGSESRGSLWNKEDIDPEVISGNFTVSLIIAPDNSLHYDAIIGMIESANETVYIEEAYIRRQWGDYENPYLEASIDAARRGVDVRILVDSRWYNLDGKDDNDELCKILNDIARYEDLNLEARLARLNGISKIHNKGVIVDSRKVLISSINWNKHSPTYNREVGVIIESPEVGAYYSKVFLKDWERSGTSLKMIVFLLIMLLMLVSAVYLIRKWMR